MNHATSRTSSRTASEEGDAADTGRRRRTPLLLTVLFAAYLVLLTWIILWKLEAPFLGIGLRHVKFAPFVATGADSASEPLEVAANVLFFLPFGIYLGLLRPSWPLWKHAGTFAGASLILELGQYVLAVGSSDATDVITNTAGGLVGLFAIALLTRRLRVSTRVVTRICLIATALGLLACLAFFASPLHYAQHDVPLAESPSLGRP